MVVEEVVKVVEEVVEEVVRVYALLTYMPISCLCQRRVYASGCLCPSHIICNGTPSSFCATGTSIEEAGACQAAAELR